MLGATEPRFPNRNYYTNNFRMNVILVMPGFIFYDFRVSLGTLFVTFGVMSCAEVQSEPDSFCNKVNPPLPVRYMHAFIGVHLKTKHSVCEWY